MATSPISIRRTIIGGAAVVCAVVVAAGGLLIYLPMARRSLGNNTDIVEQNLPAVEAMPIQNIAAPVLVVHVRDDTLVPYAQGQYSAAHIPGARLLIYEQGGHLVIVKDAVWQEVRQFVTHNG